MRLDSVEASRWAPVAKISRSQTLGHSQGFCAQGPCTGAVAGRQQRCWGGGWAVPIQGWEGHGDAVCRCVVYEGCPCVCPWGAQVTWIQAPNSDLKKKKSEKYLLFKMPG